MIFAYVTTGKLYWTLSKQPLMDDLSFLTNKESCLPLGTVGVSYWWSSGRGAIDIGGWSIVEPATTISMKSQFTRSLHL